MSRTLIQALEDWLAAGENRIGELIVTGRYEVRHFQDIAVSDLESHTGPPAAREIALYDAAGNYRPLKTAPNLRRGWRLVLANIEELHEALDGFYPAMLATRLAFQQGRLRVTTMRNTLNRQSGMYAVTKRITDSQADALIGSFCRTGGGCLKTILWPIAPGRPVTSLPPEKFNPEAAGPAIPLLCSETCNLLVAAVREELKQPAQPAMQQPASTVP